MGMERHGNGEAWEWGGMGVGMRRHGNGDGDAWEWGGMGRGSHSPQDSPS